MQNRSETLNVIYVGDTHGAIDGDDLTGLGGFARMAEAVKQYKKDHTNTLFLFGGDLLGASVWSSQFKGEVDTDLLKEMGVQAFALGNHDFHGGTSALRQLKEWLGDAVPFLTANIDVSKEATLNGLIKSQHIFAVNGQKIAVVGVLTEETKRLNAEKLGQVEFKDLTSSVQEAIEQAKAEGADLVLVLSHLGYKEDQVLAKYLLQNGEDVIILGNHTHTVLGKLPRDQFGSSQGEYPTVIAADDGQHKAYITAVAHHGQALGTLAIEYVREDTQTKISACTGELIIIHPGIKPDPDVDSIIEKYRAQMDPSLFEIVGETKVDLVGLDCFPYAKPELEDIIRRQETPITNLVADVVCAYANEYAAENGCRHIDFALIHAGGIRADWRKGAIKNESIHKLLPFDHKIVLLAAMTGREIKQALEEGVYNEDFHRRSDFLVGSKGLSYQYDMTQPRGSRIQTVTLNGEPLHDEHSYSIAINSYMLSMKVGEGLQNTFSRIDPAQITKLDKTDREALIQHCRKKGLTITGHLDGRIKCAQGSLFAKYVSADVPPELEYIVGMKKRKLETKMHSSATSSLFYAEKQEEPTTLAPQPVVSTVGLGS